MNFNHLCMGCMHEKGETAVCPVCGYQENTMPESPMHLPPRTILAGRYLLGRVLGSGGFGVTYLGWDMNLNVKLAIKEYLPHDYVTRTLERPSVSVYSGDLKNQFEYGLDKFIEEARTLVKFDDHPGIISVKDFFRDNGTAYLVMNYLEGITLKEYLERKGGKIEFDEAICIMMPVMDALREVHNVGLLHRDISPDNIYISVNGQVKILDFGAARYAVKEQSKSMSVVLKPGYAPEEQYRSKGKQGPWTDVYATAATLYRTITGQVPPESLDRMDEDTLISPSKMEVKIPPQAEAALLKALSVRQAGRHQTIKEFQDDIIGQVIHDAPVEVSAPEPVIEKKVENVVSQVQEYVSQSPQDRVSIKPQTPVPQQPGEIESAGSPVIKKPIPLWVFGAAASAVVVVVAIVVVVLALGGTADNITADNTAGSGIIQSSNNAATPSSGTQNPAGTPVTQSGGNIAGSGSTGSGSASTTASSAAEPVKTTPDSSATKNTPKPDSGSKSPSATDKPRQTEPPKRNNSTPKPKPVDNSDNSSEDAFEYMTYYDKGCELYDDKDYDGAITAFNKSISLNPYYGRSHCMKGCALYFLGRYSEALSSFNKSIDVESDYGGHYFWKGLTLYALGRYSEAVQAYNKAEELDPGYTDIEYYRNQAKNKMKK